jgi:hypothetical protein
MKSLNQRRLVGALAFCGVLGVTGCDDFLRVNNPGVIDATTVDAVEDAATFSQSALNNLFDAVDNAAIYSGWFTGEIWVGDTFPTRNDVGKRVVAPTNNTVSNDAFSPLARAIATGERTQELLAGISGAAGSIDIARATFASAYAIMLMSEMFCQGVISSGLENLGGPLQPDEMRLEAIDRFERVIAIGQVNGSAAAATLANASRVGIARARLQRGEFDAAIAAASGVPAGFVMNAPKLDDPSNRAALGNTIYSFTLQRPAIVVPYYFRALNDPRVPSALGGGGFPTVAQGNDLPFHRQTKYPGWTSPVRLASHLEARYIIAEAELKKGNPAPAQALIAERRVAGSGAGGDFATGDPVLIGLLDQRARDFYLEAKHMGDWQRNPAETPYALPVGYEYYDDTESFVGNQTCFPVPNNETLNNPNFR